ncbi:ABC transporter permease [Asticcacaulis excentricus]|nr:ABC transporter permease [Asticcacaulis excentricus]
MNKALRDLIAGFNMHSIWLHQAYHTLSAKYKRTILGSLWIAGNFVFTSLAVSLVFGILFQQDLKELLPYAMLGNLAGSTCLWVITEAPELFVAHSSMIKNHAYPFTYFVFEGLARLFLLFGHNLVVFYIFMAANRTLAIPHWTIVPGLLLVLLVLFCWGLVIGQLSARFRDLRFLLPNLSTMLFFLTPIYWHVDMLRDKQWIAEFNPLYNLVSLIREPLLGHAPSMGNWLHVGVAAVVGLIVTSIVFGLYRRRIPFWV